MSGTSEAFDQTTDVFATPPPSAVPAPSAQPVHAPQPQVAQPAPQPVYAPQPQVAQPVYAPQQQVAQPVFQQPAPVAAQPQVAQPAPQQVAAPTPQQVAAPAPQQAAPAPTASDLFAQEFLGGNDDGLGGTLNELDSMMSGLSMYGQLAQPVSDAQKATIDQYARELNQEPVYNVDPTLLQHPAAQNPGQPANAPFVQGQPAPQAPTPQDPTAATLNQLVESVNKLTENQASMARSRAEARVRAQKAEFAQALSSMHVPVDMHEAAFNEAVQMRRSRPDLQRASMGRMLQELQAARPSYFAFQPTTPRETAEAAAQAAQNPTAQNQQVLAPAKPTTPNGSTPPSTKVVDTGPDLSKVKTLRDAENAMVALARQRGMF